MRIVKPSFNIESAFTREDALGMLRLIEAAGRTCYKSEGLATETSAPDFVRKIANVFKHESVIEHCAVTVRFICDRGVTHELCGIGLGRIRRNRRDTAITARTSSTGISP